MASDSVKIFYRYDGVFKRNPSDGRMLYKDGILRATLFPRNGNYEQLKDHLAKLTNYDTTDMKIVYAVEDSPGTRIFVDVQEDDDVACMLFEVVKVDLFISTRSSEQKKPTKPTLATDHDHLAPTQTTQPAQGTQVPCSSDAPSLSLRPSNENDMTTIVSDVDHEMGYEWEEDMDSPQRVDYSQALCKGQNFSDVQECRKYLVDYGIRHNFVMRFVKSDLVRVTAKCSKDGCTWRVHCSSIGDTKFFRVKTIVDKHTCDGSLGSSHQPHVGAEWVGEKIKSRLHGQPKLKPKDIMNDIQREYGVTLSYKQAWRGKDIAKRLLNESSILMPDNSTQQLPPEEDKPLLPPLTQQPTGHQGLQFIESIPLKVPYKCKRCGQSGHNRRSCKDEGATLCAQGEASEVAAILPEQS